MEGVPKREQGAHAESHVLQANLMRFPTRVYNPSTIRHRIRTTRPQVEVLDAMFEVNPSPSRKVKDELASEIGMTPKQVQVWFQNKRATAKLKQRQEDAKREAEAKRNRPRRGSRSSLSSNDASDYEHRGNDPNGGSSTASTPRTTNPVVGGEAVRFDSPASAPGEDQGVSSPNSHSRPLPKFMHLVANHASSTFFPRLVPADLAPKTSPMHYHAPWIPPSENEGTPEAMFSRHRSLPGDTLRPGFHPHPAVPSMFVNNVFGETGGIRRLTHRNSALGLMQPTYPGPPSEDSESTSANNPMDVILPQSSTRRNASVAFSPHPLASHPYIPSKPQRFRTNSRRPLLSLTPSFDFKDQTTSSSDGDPQANPYSFPSSSAYAPLGSLSYPVSPNRPPESYSPGHSTAYPFPSCPAAPPSGPVPSGGDSFGSINSRVERSVPPHSISSISTSMSGGLEYGNSCDSPVSYTSSYGPSSNSIQYPHSRLGSIASFASSSRSSFLGDPVTSGNAMFPSSHGGGDHSTHPSTDADPGLVFPPGFQRDVRRASCPANFMDTFATLQVADGAQSTSQQIQFQSRAHHDNCFVPEVPEAWSNPISEQGSFESLPQAYQHHQQQNLYPLNHPFPSMEGVPEGIQYGFFPSQQQHAANPLTPAQPQRSFNSSFEHGTNYAGSGPQVTCTHIVDAASPRSSSSATYPIYHEYTPTILDGTSGNLDSGYSDVGVYGPPATMLHRLRLPPSTSSLAEALGPEG